MTTIGIDPGLTGAIAVLDDEGVVRCLYDMPMVARSTGRVLEVSAPAAVVMLRPDPEIFHWRGIQVWVERVGPMPKQGVTSVWSFGRSLGVLEGVLAALGLPYHLVAPAKWKRHHGLIGRDKDCARTLVLQQHPSLADRLSRKKDIGRAEAILIAQYGQSERRKER